LLLGYDFIAKGPEHRAADFDHVPHLEERRGVAAALGVGRRAVHDRAARGATADHVAWQERQILGQILDHLGEREDHLTGVA
jgi:hypothetical protein